MRKLYPSMSFAILVMFCGLIAAGQPPRLFLIGDSTMAEKPLVDNPERGWGQIFPLYFDESVIIENHAKNGRSTKSFINEGRWKTVVERLREGDYVFIQFGHNDEKKEDSTRYADPQTEYRKNLQKFIHETRAQKANPILLTPVSRRKFDQDNRALETHHEYSEVVRAVAKEEQVPLIDLDAKSRAMLDRIGPEQSKKMYLWVSPGMYKALPNGKQDNTHFTFAGAKKVAGLVVEGMKELHLPVASSLRPVDDFDQIGNGKVVCLDYFFNNEWKTLPNAQPFRFHYVWEDTSNSGFSELGETIIRLGAKLDTLNVAPTPEILARVSIYLIVDPDTPAETPEPHYIDEKAATAIVEWVRSGGILLLMGNDKGNAEFEHFNMLAENFGIHFNEDSRNGVKGGDFETGAFTRFPDHPIFKNVEKIFIKELSTIKFSGRPVLADRGDVIMVYSKFGSGAVFAVGDPWFYNEYFDNRKLPQGFQNRRAAENLFRWLLQDARKVMSN